MIHEDKINYMRIASNIVGFNFSMENLDELVCLYDLILEKEGDADLHSISEIQVDVKERAAARERHNVPTE